MEVSKTHSKHHCPDNRNPNGTLQTSEATCETVLLEVFAVFLSFLSYLFFTGGTVWWMVDTATIRGIIHQNKKTSGLITDDCTRGLI